MSTAATLEPAQPLRALELANAVRVRAAELKREVRDGLVDFRTALDDERAGSIEILPLLVAQPGVGRARARRVLLANRVSADRRVRDLTPRQRELLAEACR